MQHRKLFFLILGALIISSLAAGCTPNGPCEVTGNLSLTVYRLPDLASDVFGTLPAGESHEVLAYTANGFVGFDPGIAQAGNIGLAHHRWVHLNGIVTPSCLAGVDQVTLADVQADVALSSNPTQELISQLTGQLPDGAETFIHETAWNIVAQLVADQSADFESLTRSTIQAEYEDLTGEQTESMLAVILLSAAEYLDAGISGGSDEIADMSQMEKMSLDQFMQKNAQLVQMMSNISKMMQDTAEDIIGNIE